MWLVAGTPYYDRFLCLLSATLLSTGHQATELLSGCLRTPVDNHAFCPTMLDAGGLVSAVRDVN